MTTVINTDQSPRNLHTEDGARTPFEKWYFESIHMQMAVKRMTASAAIVRAMEASFDEEDGEPLQPLEDIAAGVRMSLSLLHSAAETLLEHASGARHTVVAKLPWDANDLLSVIEAPLAAGKLPKSHRGLTACPLQGSLRLAASEIERLAKIVRSCDG